jgi:phosphoribosylamine--glycine ligase
MGTVAPLPRLVGGQAFATDELIKEIEETIIAPTLSKMNEDGNSFSGLLYPGLMLTPNGPKIIEFNARFGDPETQTYMRLLETDLLDIFDAIVDQRLSEIEIKWKKCFACNIVIASGGYPENYEKGKIISGIGDAEQEDNIVVFHAGTKYDENRNLITNGGRVLGVSATGDTLEEALASAYKAVAKISFEKMYYRKDIGKKVL